MRGQMQARGDSWRIKVYVGRSADGTKRQVERTIHGRRPDAERELARLVVEVDEGRHAAAAPMAFGELLDRWLKVKALAVEPKTLESYEWVARTYLRPALADRKLAALRPMELDTLYADLHGRGLSPRTVRICHTVVRQALEQARRWGLIARNPAVDATPPPQRRREIDPPTVDQVRALIEAARDEDPAFAVYLWVLAATGCRRGEGCALRWTDVDLDRCEVAIRRSLSQVGDTVREKDTKTHQGRRVALDEATVAVLREHRLRMWERALALGIALADDAHLFADLDGCPWRPDVCTNRFGRLRSRVGLAGVRLHDLRHFVATALGDGGLPIATISTRLGHRDKATTLNLYTHAIPATDQLAAAYLGGLLAGEPSAAAERRQSRSARGDPGRSRSHTFAGSPPGNLPDRPPARSDTHGGGQGGRPEGRRLAINAKNWPAPRPQVGMAADHPLTLTVEQAAKVLGISRSTAYELVRSGDLKAIRLRRRIVIPVAHLAETLGVDRAVVWDALETEALQPPSPRRDARSRPTPTRRRTSSTIDAPTLF